MNDEHLQENGMDWFLYFENENCKDHPWKVSVKWFAS